MASLARVSEPLVAVIRRRPGSPGRPPLLAAPESMLLATSSGLFSVPVGEHHSLKLSSPALGGAPVSPPPCPPHLLDFAQ